MHKTEHQGNGGAGVAGELNAWHLFQSQSLSEDLRPSADCREASRSASFKSSMRCYCSKRPCSGGEAAALPRSGLAVAELEGGAVRADREGALRPRRQPDGQRAGEGRGWSGGQATKWPPRLERHEQRPNLACPARLPPATTRTTRPTTANTAKHPAAKMEAATPPPLMPHPPNKQRLFRQSRTNTKEHAASEQQSRRGTRQKFGRGDLLGAKLFTGRLP
jgi:hypothetical protein